MSCRSGAGFGFVAAMLLVGASACGDGDEPFFPGERVWESEHFRYYSYLDDDSVCEGVLPRLEQHFSDTQAYLGMPWPTGAKVHYFKYPNAEELARIGRCRSTIAAACSDGLNIHTTQRTHSHELIHAYFNVDGHDRIPFLDEGLAEVMSCEQARELSPPPWREIVTEEPDLQRRVGFAGAWLVGHLLRRYPREQFLSWNAHVGRGASPEEIAAEFELAYGVSLDTMWQEVTEVAGRRIQCVFLEECGAEPVPLDRTSTVLGERCDGSNRFRTIAIERATNLVFQQDLPNLNQLSSCGELPAFVSSLSTASLPLPETSLVRLDPGKYTFGVSSFAVDAQVVVEASAAPEMGLTSRCDAATAFPFDDRVFGESARLGLTFPAAAVGEVWFVRMAPGEGKYLLVQNGSTRLATTQCLGCSDDCQPTNPRVALPLDAQGAATLRVEQVEASELSTRISIDWQPPRNP